MIQAVFINSLYLVKVMKEHKLNFRFAVCLGILAAVLMLVASFLYRLFSGEVIDESGTDVPMIIKVLIAVIASTYLVSAITMLRQYIVNRGTAFELSDSGIGNTMVCVMLFAIILVIPVKCIPWEAVKCVYIEPDGYKAEIDTEKLNINFLSKLILKFSGYHFCNKFTKVSVTEEELLHHNVKVVHRSSDLDL